jgi:hypothetical protein
MPFDSPSPIGLGDECHVTLNFHLNVELISISLCPTFPQATHTSHIAHHAVEKVRVAGEAGTY